MAIQTICDACRVEISRNVSTFKVSLGFVEIPITYDLCRTCVEKAVNIPNLKTIT